MLPIEGVVVIDLTHALAGPFCTYQLGMLGAQVIKIENPGIGDDFRALTKPTFDRVNGGKKSVTLNLKNPDALVVLERLIRSADVLIDNFKPGTAEKFGLTWDRVRTWNDKLIWCSISGFGLEGPWRDQPAVEWSVQAASGLTNSYIDPEADPRDLGLGVLDLSSGYAATTSILAALLQRAKTGQGRRIDVAMIDVALGLLTPRIGLPEPSRMARRPSVGRFTAKDRQIFLMGAHQRWFGTISKVLGEPFLADDPRFADNTAREAHAEELRQAIEARLAARTAAEWEAAFTAAGMPAAGVRQLEEVVTSPHVQQRGGLHQLGVVDTGDTVLALSPPYQFDDAPFKPGAPVPALGEHTDDVLTGLGYSADEIAAMGEAGVI